MFYITRICHNTANWQHPTGSATAETNSFFSTYGYAHPLPRRSNDTQL
jgi:hypothetical protein